MLGFLEITDIAFTARPATISFDATIVCQGWDRWFADSPLEEAVSSEPVSEAKFPASWENTGNFRNYVADAPRLREGPTTGCCLYVEEWAWRAFLLRSKSLAPNNTPPIARTTGSP
jgi:hypothetical protein